MPLSSVRPLNTRVQQNNGAKMPRQSTSSCCHAFIGDVPKPQVVEQVVEVPKTSSQDRILQCAVEQISRCSSATDDRKVGESVDERVPRQNPGADSRTDL